MIRQLCACGKSYQLKDEMVGRKVKCPACQAVFTVVPQAELAAMDPPLRSGSPAEVPLEALRPDPFAGAPLAGGNTYGTLPAGGSAMSPLGSPWTSPAGPLAASATPPPRRIYPWWIWVGSGVAGIAAIGSLLLVVVVFVRMNQPNPGNVAANVPVGIPAMPAENQIAEQLSLAGPYPPGGMTVGANFGTWQTYSSEAGGYSIHLPGKPQITPQSIESPFGPIEGNAVIIGGKSAGLVVNVSHTDLPFHSSKFPLDNVIRSTVESQLGTVTRISDVRMSGRPGREFLVEFNLPGIIDSKGLYRALGVSGRIYSIGYVTPTEQFDEFAARKCLESFTILVEPPSLESTYAPLVAGPGVPLQRQVAWVTQESKSGGFKVELPATPTNVSAHLGLPGNQFAEAIACEVQGKGAFVVAANRFGKPILPDGLPSFLTSLRMGLSSQGKISSESSKTQGAFAVHDFTLEAADGSRRLVRAFVSSEWYYGVTWFGPAEEAASPEVKRFFASFTLLPPAGTP